MKYNAYEVVNALINAKLARRWTKNDMDRLYIDLSAADAWTAKSDVFPGRFAVNRYERQNGKMWIDLKTGKVDTRSIRDADECIAQLDTIIGILLPADTPAEEPAEETAEEPAEETEEIAQPEALEEGDRPMKHYIVNYTEFDRPDISSPIDNIEAPDGYTAEQYVEDCMRNADEEWCEMLRKGWVELYDLDQLLD